MHDPEIYLFDYVPPELRVEVARAFCVGFANCMAAAAYLAKQRQLPKPRLLAQMISIVPGLDKRWGVGRLVAFGEQRCGMPVGQRCPTNRHFTSALPCLLSSYLLHLHPAACRPARSCRPCCVQRLQVLPGETGHAGVCAGCSDGAGGGGA